MQYCLSYVIRYYTCIDIKDMSKSQEYQDLFERLNYLENQLSNNLEKIDHRSSTEFDGLKDFVKECMNRNEVNIKNNESKLSILFERVERHINDYQEQKDMQWSINKNFEEMVSVLKEKNKLVEKENDLRKERDDFQNEKFLGIMDKYKTENIELSGKELEDRYKILHKHLGKSIGNKVRWTTFINNAPLETISEIVLIYHTFSIPKHSNISYYQLKRRLEDLGKESKKDIEKELIDDLLKTLSRTHFKKLKMKARKNFISDKAREELNPNTKKALNKSNPPYDPMKVFSIRLNQNNLDRLNKIADMSGNNRNELIRDALEQALERWEGLDEKDLTS